MKTASIYQDLEFNENKPAIKAILETDFTKEIRILMRENQEMKEHQTPFPIVVELLEGEIIFGVEGQNYEVKKGDLLTLSGGVPHNLIAKKESVIRRFIKKSRRCCRKILNHEQRTKYEHQPRSLDFGENGQTSAAPRREGAEYEDDRGAEYQLE